MTASPTSKPSPAVSGGKWPCGHVGVEVHATFAGPAVRCSACELPGLPEIVRSFWTWAAKNALT